MGEVDLDAALLVSLAPGQLAEIGGRPVPPDQDLPDGLAA
jgi:hypothetical protein